MKIIENSNGLNIIISNKYLKDNKWDNKDEIDIFLEKVINNLKKHYNVKLNGFYKIKIYPNNICIYIEMIKLDDDNYDSNEIDYRVVVIFNKDIYFKYEDYSLIDNENVFFYDNNYYINTNYIDDYIYYAEMGELVFIDDIDINKIKYINKKIIN